MCYGMDCKVIVFVFGSVVNNVNVFFGYVEVIVGVVYYIGCCGCEVVFVNFWWDYGDVVVGKFILFGN